MPKTVKSTKSKKAVKPKKSAKPKKSKKTKQKSKTTSWLAGIVVVSAKLVTITAKKAKKILATMSYDRQRPTRSVTIGHLMMMLRQEMFLPGTSLAFAIGAGIKKTLLDGYHRMMTLVKKGGSMKFVEVVYRCRDAQSMHNLYTCFDTGIGKRAPGDMYAAHAGPDEVDRIGRNRVKQLVSAVRFIADTFSQSVAKVQTHYTLLYCIVADHFIKPMSDLLKLMVGDMHGLKEQSIFQQPVLAVALTTLKYSPAKAREFWNAVIHNGVTMTNDPCHVCREFLYDLQERAERKTNGQRNKPTPRVMAYIVAHCFNQFCRNETMFRINVEAIIEDVGRQPKVTIARTPFSANSTPERLRQALVDLGLCEDHLEHAKEAVKLSATHYNKPRRTKKRAKGKTVTENSVDVSVNVKARQRRAS